MSSFSTALTGVTYVPPAVLLSIITLTGLYAFYQWAFVPKPLPGIPYDCESAQKVMGDILALRADPEGLAAWSCKKLQRLQSPICQALMGPKIMGGQPIVLVADVDNVREAILSRSDFDRSSYLIDRFPLFGDFHLNLKTTDQWKLSRQWSKDLLNTQYMNGVAGPAIELAAKRLIELWDGKSRLAKGRPFSMRRDIMGVSIDVILAFYFGDDMADSILSREVELVKHLEGAELGAGEHNSIIFPEAELHEFPQGLLDLSHTITSLYTTLWPPTLAAFWTRWISPQSRRQISGKERAIRQWVARAVQRIKGGNRADIKSGLDHMVWREQLAANKTSRPSKHSKQIMLDEAYGLLIAGEHTTSAAIVWIFKYLTDHPDVQKTLREEVQTAFAQARDENRLPTAKEIIASLRQLPYLRAVIEEMLRLRQAMMVPRDAARDTEILGCRIPKGTPIFLVCQGPDPRTLKTVSGKPVRAYGEYPGKGSQDMGMFDPERWLVRKSNGEVEFDGRTYPQLAFGGGLRACWGRKLADMEMQIVTTLLVWKFDFMSVPDALSTHEATYDITYRAVNGYLNVRSRAT